MSLTIHTNFVCLAYAISVGRTTDGRIFGGYLDSAWYNASYRYRYGYYNSFLFRFVRDLVSILVPN
jgi:hypothetical protein